MQSGSRPFTCLIALIAIVVMWWPGQGKAATAESRKLAFQIVGLLEPDSSLIYEDDAVLKIWHGQTAIRRALRQQHEQAFLDEFRRFVDPKLKRWIDGLFYEAMVEVMAEHQLDYMRKIVAVPRYRPLLKAVMSTAFRGDAANADIESAMEALSEKDRTYMGQVMASEMGAAWYGFVLEASTRYLQTGKSTALGIVQPNLEHVLLKYIRLYGK